MSRDLSAVEKKLLYSKVPKALGQGRKSFETKTEANAILHKAGYKRYFDIDLPIVHTDKKAKFHQNGAGTSRATVVAKSASKSKKDVKQVIVPKVCYFPTQHISIYPPKFCDHNFFLHCMYLQVLPLDKIQAGKMLIELDSDLKPDVAKIMEEFIDSNDHITMVSLNKSE
jgi:hypothetical protein